MIRTFTAATAADLDVDVNAFLEGREGKTIRNVKLQFSTSTISALEYNSDNRIPVTEYHVMAEYDEIPQAEDRSQEEMQAALRVNLRGVRHTIVGLEEIHDDSIRPETKEAQITTLREAQRLYDELAEKYVRMAQRGLVQVASQAT